MFCYSQPDADLDLRILVDNQPVLTKSVSPALNFSSIALHAIASVGPGLHSAKVQYRIARGYLE